MHILHDLTREFANIAQTGDLVQKQGISKFVFKNRRPRRSKHIEQSIHEDENETGDLVALTSEIAKLRLVLKMKASFPYLDLRKHQELRNPTKPKERLGSVFASGLKDLQRTSQVL
ncbi:hypothetical protein VNO80_03161 [Phaseolus coccineus]|uniref:Uncharacterized protein n=1 Tax=Phaseolus coccineus TaxID=3886 RepID=A0AAN9NQY8_PHACN